MAYLATHFVVDRLQRALGIATSLEYLLVGLLLTPLSIPLFGLELPGIPAFQTVDYLLPLVALAAGWVGLLQGLNTDLATITSFRDGALRVVLLEAVLVVVPVAAVTWWVLTSGWVSGVSTSNAWMAASVAGLVAWAGAENAVDLVKRQYGAAGDTLDLLGRAVRLSDMMSIVGLGIVFALFHDRVGNAQLLRDPTPVEWAVLTAGIGVGLGVLFAFFLDDDDSQGSMLLALTGIIAFASGAAWYLELCPLAINLVLGLLLANLSPVAPRLRKALANTARPSALVLLLMAGALWNSSAPWLPVLTLTAVFVGVRAGGKVAASALASFGTPLRGDLFRGTLGQGHLAIAMAVSVRIVFEGPAIDILYSSLLLSMIFHEIMAPRLLKGLLVDVGEIRREARAGA